MQRQRMLLEGNNVRSLHGKRKLERTYNKLQRVHKNSVQMACSKLILPGLGTKWYKCRRLEITDKCRDERLGK